MKKWICMLLACLLLVNASAAMAAMIGGGTLKNNAPEQTGPSMGIGSSKPAEKEEKVVGMSIGAPQKEEEPAQKSTGMGIGSSKKSESEAPKSMGLGGGAASKTQETEVQSAPAAEPVVDTALEEKKAIWLNPNPYYYPQLSDAHKAAWEKNIENALNYPDQVKASNQDRRYQALASMIKLDNPRIFWIDWIDSNARLRFETGSTATYAAMEIPGGKTLAQMQETFLAAIEEAKQEITKNIGGKTSTRDKAKSIHDWICRNNRYNYDQMSSRKKEHDPVSFAYQAAHSAYSAIVKDDEYFPTCDGYATAFKILCDEFDVPCICVAGSASFASTHLWNYVQLEDGKWYLVDTTSDDVDKAGTDYVHQLFLVKQNKANEYQFTPKEYLFSGVNPANGYSEGAAFTFPELVK